MILFNYEFSWTWIKLNVMWIIIVLNCELLSWMFFVTESWKAGEIFSTIFFWINSHLTFVTCESCMWLASHIYHVWLYKLCYFSNILFYILFFFLKNSFKMVLYIIHSCLFLITPECSFIIIMLIKNGCWILLSLWF